MKLKKHYERPVEVEVAVAPEVPVREVQEPEGLEADAEGPQLDHHQLRGMTTVMMTMAMMIVMVDHPEGAPEVEQEAPPAEEEHRPVQEVEGVPPLGQMFRPTGNVNKMMVSTSVQTVTIRS